MIGNSNTAYVLIRIAAFVLSAFFPLLIVCVTVAQYVNGGNKWLWKLWVVVLVESGFYLWFLWRKCKLQMVNALLPFSLTRNPYSSLSLFCRSLRIPLFQLESSDKILSIEF